MKMIVKERMHRDQLEMFSIEEFVPSDHLLRKIDRAVDFIHIYDLVEDLYCKDNGRPSVDPVVIFKMVLIQHIYGIPSLRRTVEEIKMNVAYRWFLGYLMNEPIPHFSTISYNFKHRYTEKTIEGIFYWILNEIERAGYLSPETVFIDGTHIKANANIKKVIKKAVPQAAKRYEEELMAEINHDREEHDKKPFDGSKPPKEKEITTSKTDPESGVFHKGEHKKCFAYTAQTGCDKNGYVMDVTVNPGNVHDSVAFDGLYDRLTEKNPEIENIVADAGYKTPWISKRVLDDGRTPVFPYKRPMGKKGNYAPYEYVYDEYFDCVVCPENHVLSYATTNREGYREFKSKGYVCEICPTKHLCTENQKNEKTVTKHVWMGYLETVEDIRYTPDYKELYKQRKETIERVFADAKEKHAMRYTPYRGLSQVTNWVRLKFAAMNLKKYAIHRWKRSCPYDYFNYLCFDFNHLKISTPNLA
jgi:transposase